MGIKFGPPRLGHVSRARVTQIMNLNLLAPDLQEDILFLPRVESGRDPVREHAIRHIAATVDWGKQRRRWGCMSRGVQVGGRDRGGPL